jgi:sulfhydrogenase subunit gamma (sulfur reductase)
MTMQLNLQKMNENLYLPEPARIIEIKTLAAKEKFFRFELLNRNTLGHLPGQFVQVSILGIGEAPISISSPPSKGNTFDLALRAVGEVTNKLHTLKIGDIIHIRGPFGHGFESNIMQRIQGKHLLFIGGGTGLFPLRSLINKAVPESANYKKISILYGAKSPAEMMYKDELEVLAKRGGNVELLETVDKGDETWKKNVGVITTLIPKVELTPKETMVWIAGPPIMYKFVLKSLMDRKIPKTNIYMSLERRMKCGVGKCGHCQMEGVYVCQSGPVFNYAEIEDNEEVL